jgi:hypothetical protein
VQICWYQDSNHRPWCFHSTIKIHDVQDKA